MQVSRQSFIDSIKVKSYRKEYYGLFEKYLTADNKQMLIKLLQEYPVGLFFTSKRFQILNNLQKELYAILPKHLNSLKLLYRLLFYPTHYIDFDVKEIYKEYEFLKSTYPHSNLYLHFSTIFAFHNAQLAKMQRIKEKYQYQEGAGVLSMLSKVAKSEPGKQLTKYAIDQVQSKISKTLDKLK